jgi:hypothetical protein
MRAVRVGREQELLTPTGFVKYAISVRTLA